MKQFFYLNAITNTNTSEIEYRVYFKNVDPLSIIDFSDDIYFNNLCKTGCPNYAKKWSCPPYSPSYKDYISEWKYLTILFLQTNMSQFDYINNNYLKIKAGNSILKSRADKYIRYIAGKHGKYISTGSCRLCKPCKCKLNQPCAYPQKMSYSYEAMGINVDMLVQKHFNSKLLWYENKILPKYTSVVCGLLTNDLLSDEYLIEQYKKYIKK